MTASRSVSSKDSLFELTAPTNFVQTQVGGGSLVEVFEPGLLEALEEDAEDLADAEATRRLYAAQGATGFQRHVL
jgi:hypothetical protein